MNSVYIGNPTNMQKLSWCFYNQNKRNQSGTVRCLKKHNELGLHCNRAYSGDSIRPACKTPDIAHSLIHSFTKYTECSLLIYTQNLFWTLGIQPWKDWDSPIPFRYTYYLSLFTPISRFHDCHVQFTNT